MTEPQLSDRSARALAHRLARREHRSSAEIVERALADYEKRWTGGESAEAFYARLSASCGEDIDLDALIADHRQGHAGADL